MSEKETIDAARYIQRTNPIVLCEFIVGIDAGRKTGVAMANRKLFPHTIEYYTWDFWKTVDVVSEFETATTGIVIEIPNAARILYARKDDESAGRGRERMAANVGSNRREAELLASRFESLGFIVERVHPTRSKWNRIDLERKTGITSATNEHTRDAIRLVWERLTK